MGPGFDTAQVDLVPDQPGIQLLKVEPRAGVTLDARREHGVIHIAVGAATPDGSLGMLTFQAAGLEGPVNLSLQNLKVQRDNAQLAGTVALPKTLTISD